MAFNLKALLARGPEAIRAEKVFLKEFPLEELGFTLLFILMAGFWLIFSDDVVDWIMGVQIHSPYIQTLRGINFVITTGLVLYLVLRRTLRRRRAAEEALRLSQRRFESVAFATNDAIWDLNLDSKVVWWSEGMYKLFGYSPQEVSSNFEWWLQRVHPDDQAKVMGAIQRDLDTGARTWTREYRFRRQDGSYALVLAHGSVIQDAGGKPVRAVGGLTDISDRRLAQEALENSRRQLRALAARLQSSREEERANVSREIHDDLGQTLTALKLNLDWLERKLGERNDADSVNHLLERVVESEEMIEGAIENVQRIATDLRPALLDNLGLAEALLQEARRFQDRTGTTCELQLPAETLSVSPGASIAIFRVFQEALTNVARHAQATTIRARLEVAEGRITLVVQDNGRGISAEALGNPKSLGLLGMSERAAALGGQLAVAPDAPQGTRVTLQLPMTSTPAVPFEGL